VLALIQYIEAVGDGILRNTTIATLKVRNGILIAVSNP
jgi:hypothetical protein